MYIDWVCCLTAPCGGNQCCISVICQIPALCSRKKKKRHVHGGAELDWTQTSIECKITASFPAWADKTWHTCWFCSPSRSWRTRAARLIALKPEAVARHGVLSDTRCFRCHLDIYYRKYDTYTKFPRFIPWHPPIRRPDESSKTAGDVLELVPFLQWRLVHRGVWGIAAYLQCVWKESPVSVTLLQGALIILIVRVSVANTVKFPNVFLWHLMEGVTSGQKREKEGKAGEGLYLYNLYPFIDIIFIVLLLYLL